MTAAYQYIVNPLVPVPGSYNATAGIWTATLPQAIYNRDLQRISVQGPANSQLKVYLGNVQPENLFDQTQRGASNTADYSGGPAPVPRGSVVNVVWTPLGGSFTGTETVSATFTVKQKD